MWHVAQCSKTACSLDQICELWHPKLSHNHASYYDKVSKKSRRLIPSPVACCLWWVWLGPTIMLNLKNPIICVYIVLELDSFLYIPNMQSHVLNHPLEKKKKKTIKPNLNLWFVAAWVCSLSMRIFVTQSEMTRVRISLPKKTEI